MTMDKSPDIQHLTTKNWFFTILLGSLLVAARMCGTAFHDPACPEAIFLLRIIPAWISVLVSSIILSLPAFLAAQTAIRGIASLKPGVNASRYAVVLLLLILVWATGAVLFPTVFRISLMDHRVLDALGIFSFSATFLFAGDTDLIRALSGEDDTV